MDREQVQAEVDLAITGLRAQGCRSVSEHGVCLYRGPNGTKCVVGHILSDHEARRYEGEHASRIARLIDMRCEELFGSLQFVHDRAHLWENGFPEAEFRKVVQDHGFVYPEAQG